MEKDKEEQAALKKEYFEKYDNKKKKDGEGLVYKLFLQRNPEMLSQIPQHHLSQLTSSDAVGIFVSGKIKKNERSLLPTEKFSGINISNILVQKPHLVDELQLDKMSGMDVSLSLFPHAGTSLEDKVGLLNALPKKLVDKMNGNDLSRLLKKDVGLVKHFDQEQMSKMSAFNTINVIKAHGVGVNGIDIEKTFSKKHLNKISDDDLANLSDTPGAETAINKITERRPHSESLAEMNETQLAYTQEAQKIQEVKEAQEAKEKKLNNYMQTLNIPEPVTAKAKAMAALTEEVAASKVSTGIKKNNQRNKKNGISGS